MRSTASGLKSTSRGRVGMGTIGSWVVTAVGWLGRARHRGGHRLLPGGAAELPPPANLSGNWSLWTSLVFALCNASQVVLMAGLIERYFGSAFSLDSLRQVLGLVAAAIVGTAAA